MNHVAAHPPMRPTVADDIRITATERTLLSVAEDHPLQTDRPSDLSAWCLGCTWAPDYYLRGNLDLVREAHAQHVAHEQAVAVLAQHRLAASPTPTEEADPVTLLLTRAEQYEDNPFAPAISARQTAQALRGAAHDLDHPECEDGTVEHLAEWLLERRETEDTDRG